jgi:hypothetical protein
MASTSSPVRLEADRSQDSEAILNISVADLLFYRAVELQTSLIQNYRNAILNMAVVAADVVERMPKADVPGAMKAAKATTDHRRNEAEQGLKTAASAPSETESAERNLGNMVAATSLLMQNCVATLQQLDTLAQAVLARSAEVILSAAGNDAASA